MLASISKKMSGVYLTGNGGFDKLKYKTDIPTPQLKADEVLVKIKAAAVNNTDINTRIGWYSDKVKSGSNAGGSLGFGSQVKQDSTWLGKAMTFPKIQGADGCGIIVKTGSQVNSNRLGQRILIRTLQGLPKTSQGLKCITFGSECNGTFAQYTKVKASEAFPIKSNLTDGQLASFPCAYSTALNLIERVGIQSGKTVLITGASGGVGLALVQLAKLKKAFVIVVCGPKKEKQVFQAGADKIISRFDSPFKKLGEMSIDIVFDTVAGAGLANLFKILKKGGKYGVIGAIAGPIVKVDIRDWYLKDLSLFGSTYQPREVFKNLIHLIESGKLKPLVAKTFPLSQIVSAQKAFLSKKWVGKIILKPGK